MEGASAGGSWKGSPRLGLLRVDIGFGFSTKGEERLISDVFASDGPACLESLEGISYAGSKIGGGDSVFTLG